MNPHEFLTILEQVTEMLDRNLKTSKAVFTVAWHKEKNSIVLYEPTEDWLEVEAGDYKLGEFSYETTRISPYEIFRTLVDTACTHLAASPDHQELYAGVVSLMHYKDTIKA